MRPNYAARHSERTSKRASRDAGREPRPRASTDAHKAKTQPSTKRPAEGASRRTRKAHASLLARSRPPPFARGHLARPHCLTHPSSPAPPQRRRARRTPPIIVPTAAPRHRARRGSIPRPRCRTPPPTPPRRRKPPLRPAANRAPHPSPQARPWAVAPPFLPPFLPSSLPPFLPSASLPSSAASIASLSVRVTTAAATPPRVRAAAPLHQCHRAHRKPPPTSDRQPHPAPPPDAQPPAPPRLALPSFLSASLRLPLSWTRKFSEQKAQPFK